MTQQNVEITFNSTIECEFPSLSGSTNTGEVLSVTTRQKLLSQFMAAPCHWQTAQGGAVYR